jgi:hypothetical protein
MVRSPGGCGKNGQDLTRLNSIDFLSRAATDKLDELYIPESRTSLGKTDKLD